MSTPTVTVAQPPVAHLDAVEIQGIVHRVGDTVLYPRPLDPPALVVIVAVRRVRRTGEVLVEVVDPATGERGTHRPARLWAMPSIGAVMAAIRTAGAGAA